MAIKYRKVKIGQVFGKPLSISHALRESLSDCDPFKSDILHYGERSIKLSNDIDYQLDQRIPIPYGNSKGYHWKAFISYAVARGDL